MGYFSKKLIFDIYFESIEKTILQLKFIYNGYCKSSNIQFLYWILVWEIANFRFPKLFWKWNTNLCRYINMEWSFIHKIHIKNGNHFEFMSIIFTLELTFDKFNIFMADTPNDLSSYGLCLQISYFNFGFCSVFRSFSQLIRDIVNLGNIEMKWFLLISIIHLRKLCSNILDITRKIIEQTILQWHNVCIFVIQCLYSNVFEISIILWTIRDIIFNRTYYPYHNMKKNKCQRFV